MKSTCTRKHIKEIHTNMPNTANVILIIGYSVWHKWVFEMVGPNAYTVGYLLLDRNRPVNLSSRCSGNRQSRMCDCETICLNSLLHLRRRLRPKLRSQDQADLSSLTSPIRVPRERDEWLEFNRGSSRPSLRYNTRCYFSVRSKADMSRLNLPHGNGN